MCAVKGDSLNSYKKGLPNNAWIINPNNPLLYSLFVINLLVSFQLFHILVLESLLLKKIFHKSLIIKYALWLSVADPLVDYPGLQPGIEKKKKICWLIYKYATTINYKSAIKSKNTLPSFLSFSLTTTLKPINQKNMWSPSQFIIFKIFQFGWLILFCTGMLSGPL